MQAVADFDDCTQHAERGFGEKAATRVRSESMHFKSPPSSGLAIAVKPAYNRLSMVEVDDDEPLNHRNGGGVSTAGRSTGSSALSAMRRIPVAPNRRLAIGIALFCVLVILVSYISSKGNPQLQHDKDEGKGDNEEEEEGIQIASEGGKTSATLDGGLGDDIVETFDDAENTKDGTGKTLPDRPTKILDMTSHISLYLQSLTCLPAQCFGLKHFIADAKQMHDPRGFTLVASFPGAGNTWTRSVIEAGTRIYTGSVYPPDWALMNDGFKGETISSFAPAHPSVSAIKTHYPLFFQPLHPKTKYVIQVLRSPFDSLLSEFNRVYGGGGDPHVHVASVSQLRQIFPAWFSKRTHNVWGHSKFWDGPNYWDQYADKMDNTNGVTSFLVDRPLFPAKLDSNRTVPVLVLFYEDFVRNFHETSLRMFKFLRETSLGQTMPPPEVALTCAVRAHTDEAVAAKRTNHRKQYNPYTEPEGGIFKRGLVPKFCEYFKDYWYEAKWGKCLDAQLQSNRKLPISLTPPLPKHKCSS